MRTRAEQGRRIRSPASPFVTSVPEPFSYYCVCLVSFNPAASLEHPHLARYGHEPAAHIKQIKEGSNVITKEKSVIASTVYISLFKKFVFPDVFLLNSRVDGKSSGGL